MDELHILLYELESGVQTMNMQEILTLFQYDEWATDRTLESVSAVAEKLYLGDLKSSHGGIHGTLVHIYSADWVWLERWKGHTVSNHVSVEDVPALHLLKSRWKEYRNSLHTYLKSITDSELASPLSYSDMKGNKHSEPLFQQMLQVVNHASYHRGQIVTMLRQTDSRPVATDLIAFYRTRQ